MCSVIQHVVHVVIVVPQGNKYGAGALALTAGSPSADMGHRLS